MNINLIHTYSTCFFNVLMFLLFINFQQQTTTLPNTTNFYIAVIWCSGCSIKWFIINQQFLTYWLIIIIIIMIPIFYQCHSIINEITKKSINLLLLSWFVLLLKYVFYFSRCLRTIIYYWKRLIIKIVLNLSDFQFAAYVLL